jgi:aspartyl/asparaginyl beta-hydroxylase (cupin superfamily)
VKQFDDLALIDQNWEVIRDEAVALREMAKIKAAEKNDDAGFNSFFKAGWKRFYLKWYNASHPSAEKFCPKTVEILKRIPSVKAAMFAELAPGGTLNPHRDPFAGSLRYHLGLVTPNDDRCFIESTASATAGATARAWCSMRPSSTGHRTAPRRTVSSSSATSSVRCAIVGQKPSMVSSAAP